MKNQLSLPNKERLQQAITLLNEIVPIGISALMKFPEKHYELLTFTFINYLERFTFSLESIEILLGKYETNPNVETSIGLTIRTGLLDFMTIAFLSTYYSDIKPETQEEDLEKFNKQFNGLLTDQINNTIRYLKLNKELNVISNEQYHVSIENLFKDYDFLFTDDVVEFKEPEKKLICTEFKSPKQLFTRIHTHRLTKNFSKVYDLYTYYSKYEHYGIMTHFLQQQGRDWELANMIASMKYLIKGLSTVLLYLNPDNTVSDEINKLKIYSDSFDKL